MKQPVVFRNWRDAHRATRDLQRHGSVALVPTMGALHEGHMSLVRQARRQCDHVAVSIFVNPTQFAPNEDYQDYPRPWRQDIRRLNEERVELVFAPEAEQMYPRDCSTFVQPPDLAKPLEGRCRPGHFRGVATIVLKLLHIVPADKAFFGEKDYQQFLVIRDLVRDLNIDTDLVMCPIIREPDGLAMSSRNAYLSVEDRSRALGLHAAIRATQSAFASGQRNARQLEALAEQVMVQHQIDHLDYAVLRDPDTLAPIETAMPNSRLLLAARVGKTRLIDNAAIAPE